MNFDGTPPPAWPDATRNWRGNFFTSFRTGTGVGPLNCMNAFNFTETETTPMLRPHRSRRPVLSLFFVLFIALSGIAPAQQASPFELERAARKQYQAKEFPAYRKTLEQILELRPNHPRILYNLAGACALTGDSAGALKNLGRIAAMGLYFPAGKDTDFAAISATPEFRSILEKLDKNLTPTARGAKLFQLADKELLTEGIAYDPVEKVHFIGSVHQRKILKISSNGAATEFSKPGDGLWGVFGMSVDAKRRRLWAASSAVPEMKGFTKADDGASGLFEYDLKTGKLVRAYSLPRNGPHVLGEAIVLPNGDVFTSDSASRELFRLPFGKTELERFAGPEPFYNLQGLAATPDGKTLYIADYAKGILKLDLATKNIELLPVPDDVTALGVDGLYLHRGALVAVQNGVNPNRIVRFILGGKGDRIVRAEIIESNHALFAEPTLGVFVGDDFHYNGRAQWGAFEIADAQQRAAKLVEPMVLSVRIGR